MRAFYWKYPVENLPVLLVGLSLSLGACASEIELPVEVDASETRALSVSSGMRRNRAERIRDVARRYGIETGFLFAGIVQAESSFVQCGSEKESWMCSGPHSPECGGPVMAGGSDGSCSAQNGGLGMFQLDAGTYADTLRVYGNRVLSVEGNTEAAIELVFQKMAASPYIHDVLTREKAVAWLNGVRIDNERIDPWLRMLTNGYNGCPANGACWNKQYAAYRNGLVKIWDEMGRDGFWLHDAVNEHGCVDREERDCASVATQCVDHHCSGGFGEGHGCTAREERDCASVATQCVDHHCSGGFGTGHGCTAREERDCASVATQCVDHQCSGGFGTGDGCTARERLDCDAGGKSCRDHLCVAR